MLKQRKKLSLFTGLIFALIFLCGCGSSRPQNYLADDTLYAQEIREAAGKYRIPPELVRAVIFHESRFKSNAKGQRGEIGLMQILPSGAAADWARCHRKSRPSIRALYDPKLNLEIGCWYLARARARWSKYREQNALALAQYNAGESQARRWAPANPSGAVIPRITNRTTREYVTRVLKRFQKYRNQR